MIIVFYYRNHSKIIENAIKAMNEAPYSKPEEASKEAATLEAVALASTVPLPGQA